LIDSLAFLALAMTAALCEEVLYRGFLFEVILRASSSALAAIVGSSVFSHWRTSIRVARVQLLRLFSAQRSRRAGSGRAVLFQRWRRTWLSI